MKVENLERKNAAAIATVMKLSLTKSKINLNLSWGEQSKDLNNWTPATVSHIYIAYKAEQDSVLKIKTELKSHSFITITIG